MSNTKTKAKAPAKKRSPNDSETTTQAAENKAASTARMVTSPTVRGAVTAQAFSKTFGETDLAALIEVLADQNKSARNGDLARAENMLMTQAHTLDAIFNELARRAASNMGEYMNAMDRYLRLALKAQSQCRATLETLVTIKNPPVIYAKQANIANGPQQVNNGQSAQYAQAHAPAGNSQPLQNKLLEHQHGDTLEFGAQGAAGRANPHMATVG